MAVTLTHVADASGCSVPTVSRVFRNPELVADETRHRVLAMAKQLGYTPPRSRASRARATVGLVVSGLENPFFPAMIKAVLTAARQRRLSVYLTDPESQPEEEEDLVLALAGQADALILWAPRLDDQQLREVHSRVPTIIINRPTAGCVNLLTSTADGMRQAVEHLRALGHQRCAFVAAGGDSWTLSQRSAAVRSACADNDIELAEYGPYSSEFDSGVQAADLIIASEHTAAIAQNDLTAQGLLRQLNVRGIRVPQDISLIGVNDSVIARRALPSLTSVHIPIHDIAARSVAILANTMADPNYSAPATVEFPTRLVVRESTTRARSHPLGF